ncbi:MAG: ABC transporter ATP-binding protein [Clostridiales bacterium]|nr:ABC transporter ATP-binding protein [Clostridiales bacterium]
MLKKTRILFNSLKYSFSVTFKSSPMCFLIRIFVQLVNGITPLFLALLTKGILDVLVDVSGDVRRFIMLSVYVLGLGLIKSTVTKTGEYFSQVHRELISKFIKLQISKKAASLDISYFDSTNLYDELQNVRRDSGALSMMTNHVFDLVRVMVQLVSAFTVMVVFNIWIGIGLIILYIPFALISRRHTKIAYKWTRGVVKQKRHMGYSIGLLSNRMTAKELRLYDYGDEMIDKYEGLWIRWFAQMKSVYKKRITMTHLSSIIPTAAIAGISVYVGLNVLNGSLSIGDFSLYGSMTAQLSAGISGSISVLVSIYESNMKIEFLDRFMKWENKLGDTGEISLVDSPEIEFRNIYFKYPNMDRYVLEDISFKIYRNEKLALVGVNGAGKTTIIKLLLRLYDPEEGEILINGISLKEYDLKAYRKLFSVMFQRFGSYSMTVEESIGLANLNLSKESSELKMKQALAFSGVDKILSRHGKDKSAYLTRMFSNNGMELSGGEWQKMALARLFYSVAPVYVLDEPSASLDPESEKEIFEKIVDICNDSTAILISHRLSNVLIADRILVIEEGRLIEKGTHDELMDSEGRYAYLFRLQAERYGL